jgi:Peptidase A4 family
MQSKAGWASMAAFAMVAVMILPGVALGTSVVPTLSSHFQANPRAGTTPFVAENWAGYAAENTSGSTNFSVTKVTGHWTQPAITCSNSTTTIVVIWVGIDGASSPTVEQTGSLGECVAGTPSYALWWELYPKNSVQIIPSISVSAGDKITASVSYSTTSGKYTMRVADGSHSFTKVGTQPGTLRSSAECIVERPSGTSGLYPLAKFGVTTFTSCTAVIGGHSGAIGTFPQVAKITMVGNNGVTVIATTSALHSSSGFSVTWKGYS